MTHSKADDILVYTLQAWGPEHHDVIFLTHLAWDAMTIGADGGVDHTSASNKMLAALEDHILRERLTIIEGHLATKGLDLASAKPHDIAEIDLPAGLRIRLTTMVGFYNTQRIVTILIIHAWLHKMTNRPSPWDYYQGLLDEYAPANA